MRVISWNMNKRSKENCWEFAINNLNSDFVMAQEASPLINGINESRDALKKQIELFFILETKITKKLKWKMIEVWVCWLRAIKIFIL